MVWKTVNQGDAGTSARHGGNDLDKVANLFNGVLDVDSVNINSPWTFTQDPIVKNYGNSIYTAVIAGTTTKLRNNITGLYDYTADNTVNSITAINSALANIKNVANIDATWGGSIQMTDGVYKCTTSLDMTFATMGRHGMTLRGNGNGTILNFVPTSALTDAVKIQGAGHTFEGFRILPNTNVTNAVHVYGVHDASFGWKGSRGRISDLDVMGPTFGSTQVPTAGMVGIFMDGVPTGSETTKHLYFWKINNCHLYSMGTGILTTDIWSTSTFINDCSSTYCTYGIDISAAQHHIDNFWAQGGWCIAGVRLRGTASHNFVANTVGEIQDNGIEGTVCTTVLLELGAFENAIIGVNNVSEGQSANSRTIRDLSGNAKNIILFTDGSIVASERGVLRNTRLQTSISTDEQLIAGISGLIGDIGTSGGTGTWQLRPVAASQAMMTHIRPSITTIPSDTALRNTVRIHNMVPGTDSEFLDIKMEGTDGIRFNAGASGSGVVRDMAFAVGNVNVMKMLSTGQLQILDRDVILGTTTGTRIGTSTSQKIGFYNKTPVTQRAAISSPTADTTSLKTAVDAIRQVLIDLGLTA